MAKIRYERQPGDPLTRRQKGNLKRIAAQRDKSIDFTDIPELSADWFARAIRGKFYRSAKELVSIRLDKDVIEFFRKEGAGYQTRINDALRKSMEVALSTPRTSRRRAR